MWLDFVLDRLARQPAIGYLPDSALAAEPTAIAALALAAHGRTEAAQEAAAALVQMQAASGAVGIRAGEESPGWPTSLAIAAWCAVENALRGIPGPASNSAPPADRHKGRSVHIDRAVAWLLANRGQAIPRSPDFGHNSELVGWAYAEKTHSWVEPTSLAVLALKTAGQARDPAAREGVAVLIDRQLPGGGHNYGNTYVLGQLIRPHVQPTGLALLALGGETDASGRMAKSIAWLRRNIGPATTPLSLGWALLGLNAHGVTMPGAQAWLATAARGATAPHKLALLALAAKGWPV